MGMNIMPVGPGGMELGVGLDELCGFALAELDWGKITGVVCGVNPGWDQAVALTAIDLSVPIHVVIPYNGWEQKFSKNVQKACKKILDETFTLTYMNELHDEGPSNRHMAEFADMAIILGPPGWTNDRARVAMIRQLQIQIIWSSFCDAGYGMAGAA